MLLLNLEKPRRTEVGQTQHIKINKEAKNINELTISTYRNICKILKRQSQYIVRSCLIRYASPVTLHALHRKPR